jgi:FixJ family two-component response regulator
MPQDHLIYVVDGEAASRNDLSLHLRRLGCRAQALPSGAALLASVAHRGCACAVLDVNLPGGEVAAEIFERLRSDHPGLPVIFVAAHCDLAVAVDLMRRGAIDFLTRPVDASLLRDAVARALARSETLFAARARGADAARRPAGRPPRPRQVLELVWTGRRNREIAVQLASREATIKVHRSRLMRKLEASSLVDVIRMAQLFDGCTTVPPRAALRPAPETGQRRPPVGAPPPGGTASNHSPDRTHRL